MIVTLLKMILKFLTQRKRNGYQLKEFIIKSNNLSLPIKDKYKNKSHDNIQGIEVTYLLE